MIDEGYVKFNAVWQKGPAPLEIEQLVEVRNQLYRQGLIGVYHESGIGFGNISIRLGGENTFVISGSSTGHVQLATSDHFCIVDLFDIVSNTVHCQGPVTASSESLTHAMLYACSSTIGAVVHVHHLEFWRHLLQNAPCSAASVAYGTPEMAKEMSHLMKESDLPQRQILAMTGHEEGIIAIGPTVDAAADRLLLEFQKWKKMGGGYKTQKKE